eukprot:superscaffoldBa00002879_g15550
MNLFCFTLEGSTESVYEPAYSQTLKEVLPKYQCSPLLRHKHEWGGSDPSINSGGETAADTAESMHTTRRLKKLQNLVQAKRGHQSGAGKGKNTSENDDDLADVLSDSNPVLTCIGLGKRTEKKPCKTAPSPQQRRQQQQAKDVYEDSEEEGFWSPRVRDHLWSPFDCSQPWSPFYHTCQQPRHELWGCGGTLSLPRTTEWDRFESLIQELDSKQSDLSPPQMIRSITDLHLTQNALTRFGRFDAFRQHSPLMKTQDNGSSLDQNGEPTKLKLQGREMETSSQSDRSHIKALPEKTLTAIINGETQEDKVEKREVGGGWPFTKGHRRSSNSLESLYSLNSRQSSSSGVTSGSNCSSNRGSLRLEDDLSYTRQFCGRARVHTDFVPSPYDTESLKLKEYSSSLQLNGYQTVDDLMRLREHHLTELNVTDPEHRHRLLAAVDSLQQLRSDCQLQNEANQGAETPSENMKADMNNCPRDSGCHMPSDSPDNSGEDTDLHFPSEHPLPAETTAS